MAWIQGTRDARPLGPYRPTGGPPVPYGAYGNYLVPIGAVHEGTPADGPASSSFGLLGALGSRGAHDPSTGPRILASLNTDAATFAVNDGAAPHRSRPEQVGYHRDATSTLAETPGAGNPSAEATPSQIQGVLNPGGGLARQAAGVAKAGPVVISSGPESDTAAVVDEDGKVGIGGRGRTGGVLATNQRGGWSSPFRSGASAYLDNIGGNIAYLFGGGSGSDLGEAGYRYLNNDPNGLLVQNLAGEMVDCLRGTGVAWWNDFAASLVNVSSKLLTGRDLIFTY